VGARIEVMKVKKAASFRHIKAKLASFSRWMLEAQVEEKELTEMDRMSRMKRKNLIIDSSAYFFNERVNQSLYPVRIGVKKKCDEG
jgi:hypothetical protein